MFAMKHLYIVTIEITTKIITLILIQVMLVFIKLDGILVISPW